MNSVQFHKMQGAGNDFIVFDNRRHGFSINEIIKLTPKFCDRRFGIGADGVLVLEQAQLAEVDFTMIYRNADGSDAGMCGNGARCLSMFAVRQGFESTQKFNVHNALYTAKVDNIEQLVSIHFPDVESPIWFTNDDLKLIKLYPGTEHVVCLVDAKKLHQEDELVQIGRKIRNDKSLNPPGTNVNFISLNPDESLSLQTYERGVESLTLACGTGAIASAISSHFVSGKEAGDQTIHVHVKGGNLSVSFHYKQESKIYQKVVLTGPAEFVYEGEIHI